MHMAGNGLMPNVCTPAFLDKSIGKSPLPLWRKMNRLGVVLDSAAACNDFDHAEKTPKPVGKMAVDAAADISLVKNSLR